jgi:hypothetical protein
MIILQNCQQVNKRKKKKVYKLCLVFEKIEEIQRNYRVVLLSPFHDPLEKHISSKRNYLIDR